MTKISKKRLTICRCLGCGHIWGTRLSKRPVHCSACKRPKWWVKPKWRCKKKHA